MVPGELEFPTVFFRAAPLTTLHRSRFGTERSVQPSYGTMNGRLLNLRCASTAVLRGAPLVIAASFELATSWFVTTHSIRLSYAILEAIPRVERG